MHVAPERPTTMRVATPTARVWLTAVACWLGVHALQAAAPTPALAQLAYIDPGAGSFLVQAILGVVAAVAVTVRMYWVRIKAYLGIEPDQESAEPPDSDG
jgi:hypothetical protein